MTSKAKMPECPSCGDSRAVHRDRGRWHFCHNCQRTFEDDPKEVYYTDPTRRIQVEEERARRRREKRKGRQ